MRCRPTLFLITLVALSLGLSRAELERRLPTIGQIYFTSPTLAKPVDDAFRAGLRSLGYVDGKNITLIPLYAQGQEEQIPVLVKQLMSLHVDVMVVSIKAMHAATQATKTIPIVCPYIGDPVKAGLVSNLAHPGGNFTGLSGQNWEMDAKRFELVKEIFKGIKRVALLYDANFPDDVAGAKELQVLAKRQGVRMRLLGVHTAEEIHIRLSDIDRSGDKALIVFDDPFTGLHQRAILDLAANHVPVISEGKYWAEAGALITYGANGLDLYRRSASYVDRILRGAKPGDLPIEQAEKFEFVINLRTAKEFGITIPDAVLLRADEIIR